jgi:hypothetical protein
MLTDRKTPAKSHDRLALDKSRILSLHLFHTSTKCIERLKVIQEDRNKNELECGEVVLEAIVENDHEKLRQPNAVCANTYHRSRR